MSIFYKNDTVICIRDCKSNGLAPDIKKGDILIVKENNFDMHVWFTSTPYGEGSYDVKYFENCKKPQKNGLPAKFFIKRKPENAEIINKWFTQNTAILPSSQYATLYYPVYRGADNKKASLEGYVEITFKEFCAVIHLEPIVNNYSIF